MKKMRYAVVVSSKTGNTEQIAREIPRVFDDKDCLYFGKPDEQALKADRLFVGFWTDKGTCDEETAAFLKTVTKQEVFLFGTAGFGGSPEYYEKIMNATKENLGKDAKVIGTFMCQGKMPAAVKERYLKMKDSPEKAPNLDALIENFDKALTHPDRKDLADMTSALKAM